MSAIELTQDDKIKAAYALNLCTVSVSQIVDYDDINILEQEYEAILNNLNLEHMPHDEALLNILKQLLDTITFFRIQDGDKQMIDLRYRQKVKNAIWNAVPNFGLIVAGGNPVTIAISLASQIGIGYMNYRKTKADNNLEYQEEMWNLQKAAMEQFNGLQRELFDTAWRLADAYGFSDEMRLSERQIKHYDSILMDDNSLRRYDRLDSIKDNFVAYPPFWYYMGNTANEISRDVDLAISEETRSFYRGAAKECFEKYWETNKYPLLREDQISSSCALELADLLIEDGANSDQISELIDKAVKYSGNAWDILQLCVIGYMRAGIVDKAVPVLKILVNERYNTSLNAQILSGIYINQFSNENNVAAKTQYEILWNRVNNSANLLPWPEEGENIGDEFNQRQRLVLIDRYEVFLESLNNKYTVLFNKILPVPDINKQYNEDYFTDAMIETRTEQVEQTLLAPDKRMYYLDAVKENYFLYEYIDLYNELISHIEALSVVGSSETISKIAVEEMKKNATELKDIQERMSHGDFTVSDYERLQTFTASSFRKSFFDSVLEQIKSSVNAMSDMSDFSMASAELSNVCRELNIPWPDLKNKEKGIMPSSIASKIYIDYEMLGGSSRQKTRIRKQNEMKTVLENELSEIIIDKKKATFCMHGSNQFDSYFRKMKKTVSKLYKQNTLAVLDDQYAFSNFDFLFTVNGIVCMIKDSAAEIVPYDEIVTESDGDEKHIKLGKVEYYSKFIDIDKLYALINKLSHMASKE